MREDWEECKADEFGELIRGITYNKNQASDIPKDNYLPILRANNINNNRLNFNEIKYVDSSLIGDIQKIIPNDIVIAMSSGSKHLVGKSAQSKVHYDGSFGAFCSVYRPNENVDGGYISYFFQSNDFRKNISEISKGSNINNLKREHILDFVFPLAPLPIQRAIVSKIEALFSDLDNGIANFKKAQEQLKIYRQAVLKKAFEGELTKEWREKQANLPTAEELLKQIKEERQNHYNQQIEDWKKAVKEWEKNRSVGKKPSKPTQPKELPPLKKEELEKLSILPIGWAWCKNLNVSTKITDGEHITPVREKSGYYLLSARNIQNGYISYSNVDYVGEDEYLRIRKRCNPEFGDILISCSGSVGRISLVPKNSNFVMVRSVALVKTNFKIYNPKFLEYLFLSPELQSQIEEGKKATAQANLFLDPIGKLNVIVCSLEEQTQIVQEIESRLSVCDKMEQTINESIEKAEALRQSILKKAFEGKLLSKAEIELCKKEADYEPASELLKKIQAEKLAKEQEKKKPILKKKGKK